MSFKICRKTSATTKTEWIVPNLFVRNNVNLIDGRKSSGKSSVIARVLGDWHNTPNLPVWQRLKNILWLSSEEDYEIDIKPRLVQYGIHPDQVTTIDYKNGNERKPILPIDRDKLADFIRDNKINALVIDPFRELIPVDWSINSGDQMRPYMTSVVSICSMTETTAFMPRHMRKAKGDFSGDDGEGSNQIKASIRHPLRIDATEEKIRRRFITVEESNIAASMLPLQFDCIANEHSVVRVEWMGHKDISVDEIKKLAESKVKRSKLEDAKKLLLEALSEGEVSSKVLIQEAKDYGIGDRTLDDAKADLGIKSIRKIDASSATAYWVWILPDDSQSPSPKGNEMPQLTLEDLPEIKEANDVQVAKMLAEVHGVIDPKPKATKPKATKPKATKPKATKPKATKPKASNEAKQ